MAKNKIDILITARDQASKKINKVGASAKKLGKLAVAGGAIAAVAIGGVAVASINAVREQIRVEKQLDAVLKSTGNAAGFSADEIKRHAAELQKVTNFGDEATIGAQNLLLTFKEIGKDVFPRATETLLDMSAAMGTGLKESAIQLGKALNDPTTGISALSRVGITFTEEQKETIKTMQEMGDTAGAQALILAELESQFKGSAKAQADPIIQAKNAMGDLAETIGKGLLPVITPLLKTLAEKMPDAIDKVKGLFGKLTKTVDENADSVDDLKVLANLAFESIQFAIETLAPVFKFQMGIMKSALGLFLDGIGLLRDSAEWLDVNWDRIINGVADSLNSLPAVPEFLTGGIGGAISSINPFDDFIMRPGQKPIAFSPQDTIVGFKGDSPPGARRITSNRELRSLASGGPSLHVGMINVTVHGSADMGLVRTGTKSGILEAWDEIQGKSSTSFGGGL